MLVRNRKLILNLRDPEKVTQVIPAAKKIEHEGHTLVAVPHRTAETKLLRNLGFDPPDPIDHYYAWPIRQGWEPWDHQKITARFLTRHTRAYCLSDMGTAKTLSSLWAADFLRQEGAIRKILVVSPLSTVERTWGDELFYNFPHLKFAVLHGSKKKRQELLDAPVDLYIINHDGVKVILPDLLKRQDIDLVIIDELSQAARNAGTDRWKAYRELLQGRRVVWGMTGTPTPNEPTDAWAQCRLITPHTVPPYFSRFRDQTMVQATQYKWIARAEAPGIVHKVMQPSIRYSRDECISLPPVLYESREAELTKAQAVMFKEMLDELHTEWQGKTVTAVNEAVKAMKLVQIACGAVIGEDSTVLCPPKHRLIALREVVEEAASKVIIFVPFRAALDQIASIFSTGYSVGVIHGGVGKAARDEIISGFQNGNTYDLLVAQPAAMSHGLTLTAASVIVWFAPVTSAETYEQANARITRPGQKHSQLIVNLQGTALERQMYNRLKAKSNMQGILLDLFEKRD